MLAQNFFGGLEINGWMDLPERGVITGVALGFMLLLAAINLRGVGESVKFNVVLTLVEMTALCIVIGVGFYVMAQGSGNFEEITVFTDYQDKGLFLAVTAATSIAFFAMVGFEDSVNMVEATHNPERIFPRSMLAGLGVAVILYMLVAVSVVVACTVPSAARGTATARCFSLRRGHCRSSRRCCAPSSPVRGWGGTPGRPDRSACRTPGDEGDRRCRPAIDRRGSESPRVLSDDGLRRRICGKTPGGPP